MYPIDVVLAVTYRCNARCVMCDIWKDYPPDVLRPEDYERLPTTLKYVNVSGGEPFLRPDLPEIIEVVLQRSPRAQVVISSNGFLPRRVHDQMARIVKFYPRIGIGFSVDGLSEMHHRIRGIAGGFERLMESLRICQDLGVKNIRIAFTASRDNVGDFRRVYELANEMGVQFTCAVAQDSSHYFKKQGNITVENEPLREELEYIVSSELRSSSPKRWMRAYFESGLYEFAAGQTRLQRCHAGSSFFFLDSYGNVYPCNVLDEPMGNIREQTFEEIWFGKDADRVRETVEGCPNGCWMICTARTSILESKSEVLAWVAKNKIRAHRGQTVVERIDEPAGAVQI
ncbi:MAG: radical SAM protein [Candidatus Sumerlaeia bacterium]|nr:radical SAM protein [Candidatus Sumerlaeia bacterium]